MGKPTLSVDFDGVLHSYASGWKGARVIPDPPVPGSILWLVEMLQSYEVAISSARSGQWGGRWAMKRWLRKHAAEAWTGATMDELDRLLRLPYTPAMNDEPDEADSFGRELVRRIQWPRLKPSAVLYIDDRAHCFTGAFPTAEQIRAFKPWNRR